ncbi:hypothetical protein M2152_000711 [Microbacteriaceae bacterium SG_E_30_P1]|uniref:Fe-S oxidoreductase n=1 Tax=Antiquaquibacter oligotrophicus TaxID=2880260 RepID=A0ABT6KKY2_9MICO|nr:hypothetical protein [Antiquaquibacter oligotrophicus]
MRQGLLVRLSRVRWLRAVLLSRVVALPGYWFATAMGFVWGALLSGFRISRRGGVVVARGMPGWAFGRGGTTIGAVYLTSSTLSDSVLEHEAVHRAQWRRYGLAFIPLYLMAGQDPLKNRFEIEAGLAKAGYR